MKIGRPESYLSPTLGNAVLATGRAVRGLVQEPRFTAKSVFG
jgi:hypothetical protein